MFLKLFRNYRNKLPNIILLIFSLIFSLLICEFILYITDLSPSFYQIKISSWDSEYILSQNKALFYEPKPNSGRFNKGGYIGNDLPPTKTLKRTLFLGDSVTYGVDCPIDYNFVTLLENEFKNRYEISNFAVPGYNIIQYYEHLKQNGVKLKPDIVIVCICENDFLIKSQEISSFVKVLNSKKYRDFSYDHYNTANNLNKILQLSNVYRFVKFYYSQSNQKDSKFVFKNENYRSEDFIEILNKFEKIQTDYNFKILFVLLPTPPNAIQQHRMNKLKKFLSYTKKLQILDLNSEIYHKYPQEFILTLFRDTWHFNKNGHSIVFEYFKNNLPAIIENAPIESKLN